MKGAKQDIALKNFDLVNPNKIKRSKPLHLTGEKMQKKFKA